MRILSSLIGVACLALSALSNAQYPDDGLNDLPYFQLLGTAMNGVTYTLQPGVYDLVQPQGSSNTLSQCVIKVNKNVTFQGTVGFSSQTTFRYTGFGVPLFVLVNTGSGGTGVKFDGIKFVFAGTRHSDPDDLFGYFGSAIPANRIEQSDINSYVGFSPPYGYNMKTASAAILGLGAENTIISNCSFESEDLSKNHCASTFIHFNATDENPTIPGAGGPETNPAYLANNNQVSYCSFTGYIFGISFVCQRNMTLDHISGDYQDTYRLTDGNYGHLIYLCEDNEFYLNSGNPKCHTWSNDITISNVTDYGNAFLDFLPTGGPGNSSVGHTVKLKAVRDSSVTYVTNYGPHGLLDVTGARDLTAAHMYEDMSGCYGGVNNVQWGGAVRLKPQFHTPGNGNYLVQERGPVYPTTGNSFTDIEIIGAPGSTRSLAEFNTADWDSQIGTTNSFLIQGNTFTDWTFRPATEEQVSILMAANDNVIDWTYDISNLGTGVWDANSYVLVYANGAEDNTGTIHIPLNPVGQFANNSGGTNSVVIAY